MIKAIAFDFDHTLYDRDATYENLVDDFMAYFADELQEGMPVISEGQYQITDGTPVRIVQ